MNTNNYLKQIAEMLGVDIGEPFMIEGYENSKFKITKEFFLQSTAEGTWFNSSAITGVLEGRKKIIKMPEFILTKKEKSSLALVVKPLKKEIKWISKRSLSDREYINIKAGNRIITLRSFATGKMYRGMESEKEYSLEEIGLN